MSKNIKLAEYAGFCYGVKRAVDTVIKLKSDNPSCKVCVLGELIHNSAVIEDLKQYGIDTIDNLPEKGEGICVVRTHGESPEVFEKIKNSGFKLVDLTCPDVKKVQQKAIELVKNGYFLVIVGKNSHPEVVAITANAKQFSDNVLVCENIEQLKPFENVLKSHKKIGVVVQTTQMISTLNNIVRYLTPISKELIIANTICKSTSMRQNQAKELAKNSDLMIVVGSKKSANTTHLAKILEEITKTIHIETSMELENYMDLINKSENISVTAGASTPKNVIDDVLVKLHNV